MFAAPPKSEDAPAVVVPKLVFVVEVTGVAAVVEPPNNELTAGVVDAPAEVEGVPAGLEPNKPPACNFWSKSPPDVVVVEAAAPETVASAGLAAKREAELLGALPCAAFAPNSEEAVEEEARAVPCACCVEALMGG